jgi:hypothetical protein
MKLKKCKKYRNQHKLEISEYHKQYRIDNIIKIRENEMKYNALNKEIISIKGSIKILCECGCEISKRNIATHRKTEKHFKNINKI